MAGVVQSYVERFDSESYEEIIELWKANADKVRMQIWNISYIIIYLYQADFQLKKDKPTCQLKNNSIRYFKIREPQE
jgi:hypothetical protein